MTAVLFIGSGPITAAYSGQVDSGTTNATSHSLSIATGTADSTRVVVVALITAGVAPPTVSGTPTIGGVNATVGTFYGKSHVTGEYGIQYIWAPVPTGTSATVAVTFTNSGLVVMHGWSVTGSPAITKVGENANVSASTAVSDPSLSLSTAVANEIGGVTIATVSAFHNSATTVTLTAGVSQDVDTNQWTTGGHRVSGHLNVAATNPSLTVTANRNASGYLAQCWSIAAISFR